MRSECLVSICAAAQPLNYQFSAACRRRCPLSLEMKHQLVASTHGGGSGGGDNDDDVLAEPAAKTMQHMLGFTASWRLDPYQTVSQ